MNKNFTNVLDEIDKMIFAEDILDDEIAREEFVSFLSDWCVQANLHNECQLKVQQEIIELEESIKNMENKKSELGYAPKVISDSIKEQCFAIKVLRRISQ